VDDAKSLLLSEESRQCNYQAAQRHGVVAAVHPLDYIYRFVRGNKCFANTESAVKYYFDDGARSAAQLTGLLATLGDSGDRTIRLLEFAAGYGCVARHLVKNPIFDLVSCDIHQEAIDFLTRHIGVNALLSERVPERFAPDEKFDVTFALSFFSHMPRATFGRWLQALYATLKRPGYLIFTTHGLASRKFFGDPEMPADGFWFLADSEQKDLETAEYGQTIVTPEFTIGELYRQTLGPLVAYEFGHWWGHQDLWVVKRDG
jgi:hypothetical protein